MAADNSLFFRIRQNRSLLMGLAILGVVIFHAPFSISGYKLRLIHDNLCCGVDLFLFFSGLGACHSISAHGGRGYLQNRVRRILPGLYLFLIPWCLLMMLLGYMNWKEFFGSVTLLGWWLGIYVQLNWYFSAIWAFFLLAVPLYRLFCKTRHTLLLYLALGVLTLLLQVCFSGTQISMLLCRLLTFLTGMLFGRLEQTGFSHVRRLRLICLLFFLSGLYLLVLVARYQGWGYSQRLGLGWYPYTLIMPGFVVLAADCCSFLRRFSGFRLLFRVLESLGTASSEILAVHMGIFKLIWNTTKISNFWWLLVTLLCLAAGVAYRRLVVERLPV